MTDTDDFEERVHAAVRRALIAAGVPQLLMVDGKNHHLGIFATKAEATSARRTAEARYFGELCP